MSSAPSRRLCSSACASATRDSALTIGQTVQVTREPGLEVDPALSPDGSLVAYAAGPPTRMQIFVRQVGGGRTIALTSDSSQGYRWPRWSPDGSRIAYQGDAGIAVVPALGGQPRLVVRLEAQAAESTTSAFTRLARIRVVAGRAAHRLQHRHRP